MKILIVDDSALQQRMLKDTLTKLGYSDFLFAGDFQTALKLFDEHLPDLVLLDVMLPGKSGMEVFRALRSRRPVPVVMVTGISMQAFQDSLERLDLPQSEIKIQHPVYVTKPFTAEQLEAAIKESINT
mgnify:CR=1 FL=1